MAAIAGSKVTEKIGDGLVHDFMLDDGCKDGNGVVAGVTDTQVVTGCFFGGWRELYFGPAIFY